MLVAMSSTIARFIAGSIWPKQMPIPKQSPFQSSCAIRPWRTLTIGIAADYLSGAVSDIGIDVFTILLAAALITFEVVVFLLNTQVERPIAEFGHCSGKSGQRAV